MDLDLVLTFFGKPERKAGFAPLVVHPGLRGVMPAHVKPERSLIGFIRGSLVDNTTLVDDQEPIGEGEKLREFGRDEEYRATTAQTSIAIRQGGIDSLESLPQDDLKNILALGKQMINLHREIAQCQSSTRILPTEPLPRERRPLALLPSE